MRARLSRSASLHTAYECADRSYRLCSDHGVLANSATPRPLRACNRLPRNRPPRAGPWGGLGRVGSARYADCVACSSVVPVRAHALGDGVTRARWRSGWSVERRNKDPLSCMQSVSIPYTALGPSVRARGARRGICTPMFTAGRILFLTPPLPVRFHQYSGWFSAIHSRNRGRRPCAASSGL